MEAVLQDPNTDAVVAILMLTREMGVPPYDFIVDLAKKYPEKPVLVGFSAAQDCIEECKAYLEPRGVPTFLDIEQPFEVLSILARCYRAMTRVQTGVTDNGAVASR
jgi:acyl-CoA synthetase (NDP forming)